MFGRAVIYIGVVLITLFVGICTGQQNGAHKILASDGQSGDFFGFAVSISGDVALIGAYQDDDKGSQAGAAYVFRYNGSTWSEETELFASDGYSGDDFGNSVALSGDVALIGAYKCDETSTEAGAAYTFRYSGGAWTDEAKLLATDGALKDRFGISVSLSGDFALIGADLKDKDIGTSDSGAAYVFRHNGTSWTDETKLQALDGAAGDQFGISVSLSGETALIGASGSDAGADTGSAYVFSYDSGSATWSEDVKLLASSGATDDFFGCSVRISGDTALIGAFGDDHNGDDTGAAYSFDLQPLTIDLLSFTATGFENNVQVEWETGSEIDCCGFHIWRSEKEHGHYTRITTQLIRSRGGPSQGARYRWSDGEVVPGGRYRYRLEDIDYGSQGVLHDPVEVVWRETLTATVKAGPTGTGSMIRFALESGVANSSRSYLLLGGLSGTAPGVLLPGGAAHLPLNVDRFTRVLHGLAGSPWCSGFRGTMDGEGAGEAALFIPAVPGFIGREIFFAYALSEPFDFASNPVNVRALP